MNPLNTPTSKTTPTNEEAYTSQGSQPKSSPTESCLTPITEQFKKVSINEDGNTRVGVQSLKEKNIKVAEDRLDKAKEVNSDSGKVHIKLENAALKGSKEVEESCRKALASEPDSTEALMGMAYCFNHQGKFREAEEFYRKALAKYPDSIAVILGLGDCLSKQNKLKEAEESYSRALRIDPMCYRALYCLGRCARLQKNFQAAEDYSTKCLELASKKNDKNFVNFILSEIKAVQEEYTQYGKL